MQVDVSGPHRWRPDGSHLTKKGYKLKGLKNRDILTIFNRYNDGHDIVDGLSFEGNFESLTFYYINDFFKNYVYK